MACIPPTHCPKFHPLKQMKLSESSVRKTISLRMPSKSQSISCYPYAPLLIILLIQSQSATRAPSTNQSLAVKFKSALPLSLSLCCHPAVILREVRAAHLHPFTTSSGFWPSSINPFTKCYHGASFLFTTTSV